MAQPVILVPLDGSDLSERSLPYAKEFAARSGAALHLLTVFEGVPPELHAVQTTDNVEEIRRECLGFYQTYLDSVRQKLGKAKLETEVAEGHPAEAIESVADRIKPLMVVLSTHGRSGLQRAVLGSVADKVVRANAFPTMLIRPEKEGAKAPRYNVNEVLVPLDGSERSEAALPPAAEIADQHGAKLFLLRVVPYATAQIYAPGYAGPVYTTGIEQIEESLEQDAVGYVQGIAGRLRVKAGVETTVVRGSPFQAITDYAHEHGVDLIVMNTHGRHGLRRMALGSVVDRVVHDAGVPVLIVPLRQSREQGS